jgi:hypothetical protein
MNENDDTLHLPVKPRCWHCNNPLAKKPRTGDKYGIPPEYFSTTILTRDGNPVKVHEVCERAAKESQRVLTVDIPEALKDPSHVVRRFAEGSMGDMADSKKPPRRKA